MLAKKVLKKIGRLILWPFGLFVVIVIVGFAICAGLLLYAHSRMEERVLQRYQNEKIANEV